MPRDAIREAQKPQTMQVLDCVVTWWRGFNEAPIEVDVESEMGWLWDNRRIRSATIFKRLSELKAAGWVVPVGARVPHGQTQPQTAYRPTAKGRAAHARWKAGRKAAA